MKRPAICLLLTVAVVGWAATGHAKKGGGKAAAPGAAEEQAAAGGEAEGEKAEAAAAAPASESLDTDETSPGKVEDEIAGPKAANRPTTTLSWQDIVVVPRKAFLKGGRFEFAPMTGITVNDNLIRHYVFGLDLNYFLTDVFWIGLQGQYYVKQLTTQQELVGLQFNRTSTLNQFLYGGALNFGYVPVYGKFALFNRSIFHWEIWASAGFGVTFTEVIARDPALQSRAFTNMAYTPNVGIGSRFFIADWITVNFALRDYIVPDRFEPNPNTAMTSQQAKEDAEPALVNNLVFYAGVGLYLPTKFTYKTPR